LNASFIYVSINQTSSLTRISGGDLRFLIGLGKTPGLILFIYFYFYFKIKSCMSFFLGLKVTRY